MEILSLPHLVLADIRHDSAVTLIRGVPQGAHDIGGNQFIPFMG
jgi:hypothetical protein